MKKYEAIIFDMDDTLYSERHFVKSGYHAVALAIREKYQCDEGLDDWLWARFLSGKVGGAFNALNDQFGLGMEKVDILELIDIYRYHTPDIQPYPGIPELIKKLAAAYKLGLISDGPKRMQRTKFETLGLGEYFSALVFTDELGAGCGKPSKVPFETVSQQLGVDAKKCVYVADNLSKDFVAPNQLGWLSVQYHRPLQVHADMTAPENGDPQIVVTTDKELLKAIE